MSNVQSSLKFRASASTLCRYSRKLYKHAMAKTYTTKHISGEDYDVIDERGITVASGLTEEEANEAIRNFNAAQISNSAPMRRDG